MLTYAASQQHKITLNYLCSVWILVDMGYAICTKIKDFYVLSVSLYLVWSFFFSLPILLCAWTEIEKKHPNKLNHFPLELYIEYMVSVKFCNSLYQSVLRFILSLCWFLKREMKKKERKIPFEIAFSINYISNG